MVMRCGYITFCNEDTNICNVAAVIVYNGNNVPGVDEDNKSIYKYDFINNKIISCDEHTNSKISYLDLLDVINKALSIDKLNNHITKYTFSLDLLKLSENYMEQNRGICLSKRKRKVF